MNLADLLAQAAQRFPDKPALVVGPRACTYAQLDAAARRTAELLTQAGVCPGRKIALSAPNGPEFVAAMMGILRVGAIAVPCPADAQAPERTTMIEQVRCEYQLAHHLDQTDRGLAFSPLDDPAARSLHLVQTDYLDQDPPDPRLLEVGASNIRFTSGTTAAFKGVVLSHEGIRRRTLAANRALGISDSDVIFFGLQMAHHFAVSIVLHLSVGATIVTGGVFLGDAMIEQIRRHRSTIIYTTPVTYRLMADAPNAKPDALRSVRLAISTAMPLSLEMESVFLNRFGVPLTQALGIIEVGMPIMNLPLATRMPGSLGRLIEDFEARVLDEDGRSAEPGTVGQLVLRGPGMLSAYYAPWRSTEEILDDGWFHTGDLVRQDRGGTFFLMGRCKDVINVGGVKVFPYEVEEVLNAHEAVVESLVTAVPDAVLGEVPAARVVLRHNHQVDSETLLSHCRTQLSHFKLPRSIEIVSRLPRTHSGKIVRVRSSPPGS